MSNYEITRELLMNYAGDAEARLVTNLATQLESNLRKQIKCELQLLTMDNSEHPGWCAYSDDIQNKCDCIVSELINAVQG